MKIGVFVSKRNPSEGGGFTITEELLEKFTKKIYSKKIQDKFFFIISNDKNNIICNKLKKKKINFTKINEAIIFTKFKILISHLFPKINYFLNYFNIIKINNLFKKEKCKKVLFISSEHREKITIPYIATVWDMQHETHPEFSEVSYYGAGLYRKIVYNNFIKNADTVIVGTKTGKSQITKFTGFKKKFLILEHPVSSIFFKKKKNKPFRKFKNNYFYYPANFWEHKNHENLIKAFKEFLKYKKNFYLVLSGAKKNNYKKIIDLIAKLNLKNKVKIVGHVNLKNVLSLYDNCDSLVYPSFSGPENLPPLEALARQKKIINSKYPGAHEQLKDFATYFNPYSYKEILSAMIKSYNLKRPKNYKKLKNFLKQKKSDIYIEKLINYLI
jgi:glycosyltransferase involved in cell wall biosynthesis